MRIVLAFFVFLTIHNLARAQDENWDVYLAEYDKGAGSTTLNMDLIRRAPVKDLPFVVITGVTFTNCTDDGFPASEEFDNLYNISDEVNRVISSVTKNVLAGTFTHQCERLDYVYVSDTINLRENLTGLFKEKYKTYKYYLNIRPDNNWETYLTFLYPNEVIQEFMSNEKVLGQLKSAGDKLDKPRQIDHWLYFKNTTDRETFVRYIKKQGFKVETTNYIKDLELPYQLNISKINSVDIAAISSLTLELRKKVKEFKGEYDGWETIVMKD